MLKLWSHQAAASTKINGLVANDAYSIFVTSASRKEYIYILIENMHIIAACRTRFVAEETNEPTNLAVENLWQMWTMYATKFKT